MRCTSSGTVSGPAAGALLEEPPIWTSSSSSGSISTTSGLLQATQAAIFVEVYTCGGALQALRRFGGVQARGQNFWTPSRGPWTLRRERASGFALRHRPPHFRACHCSDITSPTLGHCISRVVSLSPFAKNADLPQTAVRPWTCSLSALYSHCRMPRPRRPIHRPHRPSASSCS